jgi:hypothetical protein
MRSDSSHLFQVAPLLEMTVYVGDDGPVHSQSAEATQ